MPFSEGLIKHKRKVFSNEKLNVALIGYGKRGCELTGLCAIVPVI